MKNRNMVFYLVVAIAALILVACSIPNYGRKVENRNLPIQYFTASDSINSAKMSWRFFFKDSNLVALIDTALKNNQELNIFLQEVNISKNEIRAKKGEYIPFVGIESFAGVDKTGRYTSKGSSDANNEIMPGKDFPDPLQNYNFVLNASWEVDIWKKLRNAKKSALYKYLATKEGKNFMVTHLISELANSYYELIALDNQLTVLKENIVIQQNALEIVKLEKISAKVTELAVRRFEAELMKNQSTQFYIQQSIFETENRINFLVGRFPQFVKRNGQNLNDFLIDTIHSGIPSQLLENRSDIRQAELELAAAKLNVNVAKANFYPTFTIRAEVGFEAFNPKFLLKTPESIMYSLAGQLVAPLINRNAIKANYYSANAKQIQTVYNYERTVLNAHVEVVNQLSNISNLEKSYELKLKQVNALTESINISLLLFKSARADYMEVLLTQRDALESKFELIETKKQQFHGKINLYKALGGGWK
ncbi:MAG: TolC family protein [Bacteroidetes bacterium]|nr:TolC family protein [Bacteroidota bacterium]